MARVADADDWWLAFLDTSVWLPVLSLCATWTALHALVKHTGGPKLELEGANKVVSTLHATIAVTGCTTVFFVENNGFGAELLPLQKVLLQVSSGYFLYDTLIAVIRNNWDFVLHHLATASGMLWVLLFRVSGYEVCMCTLLAEVSTPFLNCRYFAKPRTEPTRHLTKQQLQMEQETDKRLSAYEAFSLAFAVTFLVSRFVVAPFLLFCTVTCPTTPLYIKVGGTTVWLVSLFWGYKVFRLLARGLVGKMMVNGERTRKMD
ncbi:unnamed protein product [Vitrella brassicaformis CCMP3155]|uniref:TLC domain-containing protein n=1 Tax=Vitrella brassicaformis (strain CCMP3155) TaxID=1169540 RepID=A0A0G4GF03_VITBC|nr:unnamed protein product [Vitrella brassicaformis CCMP3155]|eukprot:CEM28089.1 unnamed protein product [Vitrella brassicaformis CCMP3155]